MSEPLDPSTTDTVDLDALLAEIDSNDSKNQPAPDTQTLTTPPHSRAPTPQSLGEDGNELHLSPSPSPIIDASADSSAGSKTDNLVTMSSSSSKTASGIKPTLAYKNRPLLNFPCTS